MKTIKKCLMAALVIFSLIQTTTVSAEEKPEDTLTLIEVDLSSPDPLESIKQQVIENKAEDGLFDIETIDIANSTILIEPYDTADSLRATTVNITLASKPEDEEDEIEQSADSIAYSFRTKVILNFKKSEAPLLLLTEDLVELEEDDEFEPTAYIAALKDGENPLPLLHIESNVDTSEPGAYHVTYIATGANGHSTEAVLRVSVEKKPGFRTVSLRDAHIVDDGSIEAMFAAINAVRAANGLYPYDLGDTLALTAAAIRAEETSYYLAHVRPDGSHYKTAFDDVGLVPCHHPYEILVCCGSSVESNLNWWLNEPGHAAIVLGTMGDKIAIGKYGSMWAAEVY